MSKPAYAVGSGKGRKRKLDSEVSNVGELNVDASENGFSARNADVSQAVQWSQNKKSIRNRILPWLVPRKPVPKSKNNNLVEPGSSLSTSNTYKEKNPEIVNGSHGIDGKDFKIKMRRPLASLENFHHSNVESNEIDFDTKTDWTGKDFFLNKVVGTGGFSTVYEASCRLFKDQKVALKQVNYESLRRLARNENQCAFFQEYNLHRTLKHDNIVKAVGFYRSMIIQNAVMVLEYCSKGDLQDYLSDRSFPISYERSRNYIKQIAEGLTYLHMYAKIIHMDLKLENILITDLDVAKITDFGFSIKMHALRKVHWKSRGGTRWYKPPEQLKSGYFDSSADIWAYGCIAFELILDYHPFFETENHEGEESKSQEEEPVALERMVAASKGNFRRPQRFASESEQFQTFIQQLLSFSRLRRPTAKQLSSLEWICS